MFHKKNLDSFYKSIVQQRRLSMNVKTKIKEL